MNIKTISLLLIESLGFGFSLSAQYYNPYNTPYTNQQAYEWGRQMAEQMQKQQQAANQQAYNMGKAMGSYEMGLMELYNGNYDDAYNCFDDAETYKYAPAYEALGLMNELGIALDRDTDWAKMMYEEGARLGNSACKQHLQRIGTYGFYSASQKNQWLQNFRNSYDATHGGVSNNMPSNGNFNSGSSSNRSSGRTCPSCNGTGKGTDQITYAPDYTGNQVSVYCSTCGRTSSRHTHHTPNCPVCHGTGRVN